MWIAYLGAFNLPDYSDGGVEFTIGGVFGVLGYAAVLNVGFLFPVILDRYMSMGFEESRPLVTSLMFPCAWVAVWKVYGYVGLCTVYDVFSACVANVHICALFYLILIHKTSDSTLWYLGRIFNSGLQLSKGLATDCIYIRS
jgi:hypothetical protein